VQSGEGDLVVTDVVMPDENAFELLPRILEELHAMLTLQRDCKAQTGL
jgi:hypothetical protein